MWRSQRSNGDVMVDHPPGACSCLKRSITHGSSSLDSALFGRLSNGIGMRTFRILCSSSCYE